MRKIEHDEHLGKDLIDGRIFATVNTYKKNTFYTMSYFQPKACDDIGIWNRFRVFDLPQDRELVRVGGDIRYGIWVDKQLKTQIMTFKFLDARWYWQAELDSEWVVTGLPLICNLLYFQTFDGKRDEIFDVFWDTLPYEYYINLEWEYKE